MSMTIEKNKIKPMNSKEICALYEIRYEVFMAWLKPIRKQLGKQLGRMWNVKQIQFMYNHFGNPNENE